jgi:chemotaxis protein MotB
MSADFAEATVHHGSAPWLITFADLMVLLMCFFVLMLSFSEMDPQKFKLISGSLNEAFGVQRDITATDAPEGTSLDAQEFSPALPEPTTQNAVRQETSDADLERLRDLKAREEAAARQAQELRALFTQEIADGRLLIRQDGSNVVIQLLEKDSFASGSANLETESRAALAKVGELVGQMTGAIMVSGHTDNVPIRSGGAYRSNWELSAARAASVGHELLAAGLDPSRLMVSGHADTQPRVANDTAANRALNRRVDITFANGRERPGNWDNALPPDALAPQAP